jgi:CRISPR/Cas system CSM-associated protein Csm3 (group 7 of RAMP superfamily)
MGRLLKQRYTIEGTLLCEAPIHIGGAGEDLVLDMPLARDGEGKLYLPGTSLAGPIRAWWRRSFDEPEMESLFGKTSRDPSEGHGSYVLIEDAAVMDGAPLPEIRDGVGIDRMTGAAAEGIKYDREIVPKGAKFAFAMTVEVPGECPKGVALPADLDRKLGALIKALEEGRIRFGGAKTRGHGTLVLKDTVAWREALGTRAGILARLNGGKPADIAALLRQSAQTVPARTISIAIHWKPELPVMVKAGADGFLVDHLPMVTADGDKLRPVLPGSAIKGALRAQAERIWRTVKGIDVPLGQEFGTQLTDARLADRLFGSVAKKENAADGKGLSAVTVDDCHIGAALPDTLWNDLLTKAADEKLRLKTARELADGALGPDIALPVAHVAIDRWTGGSAEKLLFSALEWKEQGPFVIRLTVDPCRLKTEACAGLALLMLTLRDLAKGRIPLGYGVNRGLGSLTVEKIVIEDETKTLLLDKSPLELTDFERFAGWSAFEHLDAPWRAAA